MRGGQGFNGQKRQHHSMPEGSVARTRVSPGPSYEARTAADNASDVDVSHVNTYYGGKIIDSKNRSFSFFAGLKPRFLGA